MNLNNAFAVRTNEPEAEGALWNRHFTTGLQGLASWPRVATELQRRKYRGGERCRNGAGTNALRSLLASWLTQPGKCEMYERRDGTMCPGGCRALRHRLSVDRSRRPRFDSPSLCGASRPVPGQLRGAPNTLGQPRSVGTSRWTSRGSTRLRAGPRSGRHLCVTER